MGFEVPNSGGEKPKKPQDGKLDRFRENVGDPLRGKKVEKAEAPFYDQAIKKLDSAISRLSEQVHFADFTEGQKEIREHLEFEQNQGENDDALFNAQLVMTQLDYERSAQKLRKMLIGIMLKPTEERKKDYIDEVDSYIAQTQKMIDLKSVHGHKMSEEAHKEDLLLFVDNLRKQKEVVEKLVSNYERQNPELN